MANRTIQQKMLKKKRRGRYARFSGSSLKLLRGDVVKTVTHRDENELGHATIVTKSVFVGHVSFSKQTINTGRGPNAERMQEYYNRIPKEGPKTLGELFNLVKDKRYAQLWWETPETNRVNLVNDGSDRLDMYWHGPVWFLVHLDFEKKTITRSRDYGSKAFLENALRRKSVTWVEQIPME